METEASPKPASARKVSFLEKTEAQIEGIARKVVNIDGVRLPRRGKITNSNPESIPQADVEKQTVHLTGNDNEDAGKASDQIFDPVVSSYAATLQTGMSKNKINFRFLESVDKQHGVDVVLPRESVKIVQDKLAFTLYGYFLGDRVAYPVVEYFVRMNWKKYGLEKVMMNASGFFFFKFADNKGMLDVLEGGPWLIRNKPIFLNTWSPTSTLKKEDIKKVAVWVKLHDVPLAAYTDDGLSMLASKIGSPKLLDSYTISMCSDNWGRSSYARALIEISAENEFKDVLSMAIPDLDGGKYVTETVDVEYEWKPPRCAHCCVFGHGTDACPKQVCTTHKPPPKPKGNGDGFTEVKGRNTAKKSGFQVNNQKPKFEYRPLDYKKMVGARPSKTPTQNSFSALNLVNLEEGGTLESIKGKGKSDRDMLEDLDEEEVEVIFEEKKDITRNKSGESTSSLVVSNG